MRRLIFLIPMVLLLTVAPVVAQIGDCPAIVQQVLENLDDICAATERNEACYGNLAMEAIPRPAAEEFQFETVGDIEEVVDIASLRLSPLVEESDAWGVALMRLQANLPDAISGQSVTFILFGDVEIINAVPETSTTARPMQAFYLRTGVGDSSCAEAPESGLLVRTPEGVGEVNFSVNGVDVALGSTVFFQAQPGQSLIARAYEGSAALETADGIFPVIAGAQRSIPMTADLLPAGPAEEMEPYEVDETVSLPPFRVVRENIRVRPPLNPQEIRVVNTLVRNGSRLCGTSAFLPSCDELIGKLGGNKCPLNEEGQPDCAVTRLPLWDDELITDYDDVSQWDELPEMPEVTAEPEATAAPENTPEPEATEELPEGCYPGVCLANPEEACQCALCGVTCPVGVGDDASDAGDGNDLTDEELAELCANDPDNPLCATDDDEDGDDGDGGDNGGGDNGGGNPGDGGNPGGGGGGDPQPTTEPVVPTEAPVEPTAEPTPDAGCTPSPFNDCGGFPGT
ncbi:MAG: hypothetical protein OHK0046_12350 [Anaerolineae bacterium]